MALGFRHRRKPDRLGQIGAGIVQAHLGEDQPFTESLKQMRPCPLVELNRRRRLFERQRRLENPDCFWRASLVAQCLTEPDVSGHGLRIVLDGGTE